jgi:hypothetical protein
MGSPERRYLRTVTGSLLTRVARNSFSNRTCRSWKQPVGSGRRTAPSIVFITSIDRRFRASLVIQPLGKEGINSMHRRAQIGEKGNGGEVPPVGDRSSVLSNGAEGSGRYRPGRKRRDLSRTHRADGAPWQAGAERSSSGVSRAGPRAVRHERIDRGGCVSRGKAAIVGNDGSRSFPGVCLTTCIRIRPATYS